MFVLGISGVFGHDPAACLVYDGHAIAMAEEERLIRRKHAFGELPVQATLYCLNEAGISLDNIDCIAVSWDPSLDPTATYLHEFCRRFLDHEIWCRFKKPPIEYVAHHLSHAASAFYGSGFEEAAILVIDGNGEDVSTSIGYGRGQRVCLDQKIGISHSLGHFYKCATQYVGLGHSDEGKLMGLASYGQPVHELNLIRLDDEGYHIDLVKVDHLPAKERFDVLIQAWYDWLVTHFGPPNFPYYQWDHTIGAVGRKVSDPLAWANLAASVQHELTKTILHLARLATKRHGTRRLVLAGGVALNCSANGMLLRSGLVDDLYIMPASHDSGGALGAALYIAPPDVHFSSPISPYLGPAFSEEIIINYLRQRDIPFVQPVDIAMYSAELLANGQIIGWFQGHMEVGPRSLGNRSILALPTTTAIRDRVNRLKGRELWRPLSPSILDTATSLLLTDTHSSPYMLLAIPVTEQAKNLMPAVVHVDGSVRPQTVTREANPNYWQLLQAVYAKTGIPGVLNTSFNLAGEPIVCTPDHAIRSFFGSALDALVLGNVVVHKNIS